MRPTGTSRSRSSSSPSGSASSCSASSSATSSGPSTPGGRSRTSSPAGFGKLVGQKQTAPLRYPERLGRWPAVVGLVGFVFLELVWGQTGFAAAGLTPKTLAIADDRLLASTRSSRWACSGSSAGSTAARRSPSTSGCSRASSVFEVRDGRLGRRPFLAGTTTWALPGRLARARPRRDRLDDLRRRPGGRPQGADQLDSSRR